MRGLRTQENNKFIKYFSLIQAEANKLEAVFFADAGDGREYITLDMECEDMMGWLIPIKQAEEFEEMWKADEVGDAWSEFYVWATWYLEDSVVKIRFETE